jgi:hypothetical protein
MAAVAEICFFQVFTKQLLPGSPATPPTVSAQGVSVSAGHVTGTEGPVSNPARNTGALGQSRQGGLVLQEGPAAVISESRRRAL